MDARAAGNGLTFTATYSPERHLDALVRNCVINRPQPTQGPPTQYCDAPKHMATAILDDQRQPSTMGLDTDAFDETLVTFDMIAYTSGLRKYSGTDIHLREKLYRMPYRASNTDAINRG